MKKCTSHAAEVHASGIFYFTFYVQYFTNSSNILIVTAKNRNYKDTCVLYLYVTVLQKPTYIQVI